MFKVWFKYLTAVTLITAGALNFLCSSEAAPSSNVQNVILFIGDGMHNEHEIAASRYLTGMDRNLIWHKFPYRAYVSTWNIDSYNRYAHKSGQPEFSYNKFDPIIGYDPSKGGNRPHPEVSQIDNKYFLTRLKYKRNKKAPATDSAAAATAMATGVKTDSGNISWLPGDPDNGQIKNITQIIKEKSQKSVGVVTTVPFDHATPAAFLSHNVDRNNYYTGIKRFKGLGIADEIVEVSRPDVIIGGGNPKLSGKKFISQKVYNEILSSGEYMVSEREKGVNASENLSKASAKAVSSHKKLFGLYGGKKGNFESPQPLNKPGSPFVERVTNENPLLSEAAVNSLRVLSQNKNGFFLMIEQGDIDWANHSNDYKSMIGSVWDLNEAVKAALNFVNRPGDNIDWNNTLLIVTADHANSFMRLNESKKMRKGYLPRQRKFIMKRSYPHKEVSYKLRDHTNELVNIYAIGNKSYLFKNYEGKSYPNTRIINNTDIFKVMTEALGLN